MVHPPAGRDSAVGDRRHRYPTCGDLAVELDQTIGDLAVRSRPFERGRLDDAVAKLERAQDAGAESGRPGGHHARTVPDAPSDFDLCCCPW